MIVWVDGWIKEFPGETAFIEFVSNKERGHAGSVVGYDGAGRKVEGKSLGTASDPDPWFFRLPTNSSAA